MHLAPVAADRVAHLVRVNPVVPVAVPIARLAPVAAGKARSVLVKVTSAVIVPHALKDKVDVGHHQR